MLTFSAQAILLDIEGTVSSISFVHETLFPYARERIESFLSAHESDPAIIAITAQIVEEAKTLSSTLSSFSGRTEGPPVASSNDSRQSGGPSIRPLKEEARDAAFRLMDSDVKATGLKQLQGLIWDAGYRDGELKSPLFPDVAPAIHNWISQGKRVAIYSSGSVAAQKAFFANTHSGDLTPVLSGFFDTTTGPKRSASSYSAIARALGLAAEQVLFLSDVAQEVSAAVEAGMKSVIVVRPGNAPIPPEFIGACISSFEDLSLI